MIRTLIVISDTHIGCKFGLCPPGNIPLDEGGSYRASRLQLKVWKAWEYIWGEWVPKVTKGKPFGIVHNGDALDGIHHNSTTQISHSIKDQKKIAKQVLIPLVEQCKGNYYHIRGTEAHVGKSAEHEEDLAESLGAKPDGIGNYARWELWLRLGPALIHFSHHIGGTGSSSYESTAVYKEMVEAYTEAGRWGEEPPDLLVRSHRHRHFETRVASHKGEAISLVTPGWQLKTPFVHRLASGRASTPQYGAVAIYLDENDEVQTKAEIFKVARSKEENL